MGEREGEGEDEGEGEGEGGGGEEKGESKRVIGERRGSRGWIGGGIHTCRQALNNKY